MRKSAVMMAANASRLPAQKRTGLEDGWDDAWIYCAQF
jgi:hypothetical protein